MSTNKNNSITEPTIACFDLETTGFDPNTDAIIEVGVLKFTFDKEGELKILDKYSQLVNPKTDLPEEVTMITGIKPEDLEGQPTIEEIKDKIAAIFEGVDYILGHNVSFDISFLQKHLELKAPALDSQGWTETWFPGLPSYSLDVLPYELNIERGKAHRAYDDALVTAKLFLMTLKQYRSLGDVGKQILSVFEKGGLVEAKILKAANFIKQSEIFTPEIKKKQTTVEYPNLTKVVSQAVREGGKQIITHTAAHGVAANFVNHFYTKKISDVLISLPDIKDIPDDIEIIQLHHLDNTICEVKLKALIKKDKLNSLESSMAAKFLIAQALSKEFAFWPRLSFSERMYLPQILTYKDTCARHNCLYGKLKKSLDEPLVVLSHHDLWHHLISRKLGSKSLLLIDFDEAVDALTNKLEVKLFQNYLPDFLEAVAGALVQTGMNGLSDIIESVINKNDLFWGLAAITFKPEEEKFGILFIDDEVRVSPEYKKIKEPAEKLIDALDELITYLQNADNQFAQSYACRLDEIRNSWLDFINSEFHNTYIEKYNDQMVLKLTPSPSLISSLFSQIIPDNAVLTSATGALPITEHYLKLLDIGDWNRKRVELQKKDGTTLKVVADGEKPLHTCLQILSTKDFSRAVVVAKNLRETKLYADHLASELQESHQVIRLNSTGTGANKALYKFSKEENGILVTPPRGRLLKAPWPAIDLAIIATIPFPLPDPATSFTGGSLPSAMLAYKNLFAKILKSGQPVQEIYLLDKRLIAQSYGKNFISLAEELCGCPAQYLKS